MTTVRLFVSAFIFSTLLGISSLALASYAYIHNEGEYSVILPDAPTGITIWADQKEKIPFLETLPKFGAVGEYATVRRVDTETADTFDVKITFLKADRDFLISLTKESLLEKLETEYVGQTLEGKETSFSAGTDTLKWATLSGFSTDKNNNLLFNASHMLTGFETLMLIKVSYNAENEKFAEAYRELKSSIKFTGSK